MKCKQEASRWHRGGIEVASAYINEYLTIMEIILSSHCSSFTGTVNKHFGYAIRQRGKRFYGVRCNNMKVPPDGHWRFILACAEIAQMTIFISDVKVSGYELAEALEEAGILWRGRVILKSEYSAEEVLKFKNVWHL